MRKFLPWAASIGLLCSRAHAGVAIDALTAVGADLRIDQVITSTSVPIPNPCRAGEYVSVSGYMNLVGNGFVPQNGGFASVNVSGWTTLKDTGNTITSGNTYISALVSAWVYPNQYVLQTVRPSTYVQFYKDGRNIGSATITGSINVSGWPSGNMIYLSGSGYLNGTVYVE